MKNKPFNFIHTIRGRILLSTVSLIIIINTLIALISYFIVSSNLQKNLIQTAETRLSFLCSSIDSNINDVTNFIRFCRTSSKIKNFALEKNNGNNLIKREAHDFIMETYTSNAALSSRLIRLVVIGKSRNDIIQVVESPYSSISVSSEAILSLPYYKSLENNSGKVATPILNDPFIKPRNIFIIPIVYTIPHPYVAGDIGYIFTELSTAVITNPISNYLSDTNSRFYFEMGDYQYLYKENSLIRYSYKFKLLNNLSDKALSKDTSVHRILNSDGKGTSIIIKRPLGMNGWYMTECLDETILTKNIIRVFSLIVLIIITVSSFIWILLFWFLSKTVNVPVKKLQERMKHIANGDFKRYPATEWNHELGDIGRHINDLSENVQTLMNQRIEDERQKKDYEYKMLQSQINPHFLYNTLNSIKWMATVQNAPGIADMTTALSRLLKDVSKGTTNLVTIKHEIALIKDYFTIQQYRYGGTITLHCNIKDESLTSCKILRFTLQPIVENAIFHGIEPKGSAGTVEIHVYQDEQTEVHIDITDDGIGMTPETAAHLLNNEAPQESSLFKEIGIHNVHKRLQYKFGEKYGLSIKSELGVFTTVSILLPYQPEE